MKRGVHTTWGPGKAESTIRGVHKTWTLFLNVNNGHKRAIPRELVAAAVPAPDFVKTIAKKFDAFEATHDLFNTLHRDGALEILILLYDVGELRSTDIESLIVQTGVAESSSVWDRLRNEKAQGVVEEVPREEGAKLSIVKNRLTPAGRKLMDALFGLSSEWVLLPKPRPPIEGPFTVEP